MYISMNWIGDFVDLSGLDLESLIHRFTLSTAEVEDIFHKGEDLRDVVAGKILSVEAHPNSKKLHLLQVDAGNKIYDVVCGAPNVREGMLVPFVKEGGMVAGQEITCAAIAGVEVLRRKDYTDGSVVDCRTGEKSAMELSGSNVLRYELADGTTILVRPSGTEPKIKVYILTQGKDATERDANIEKYGQWAEALAK